MLQECSDVFGRLAGNGVEAFVGDRDRAVAKATQERLDLGGSLPDEDRLGSLGCA